jgi:hypothetical protein
MIYLRFILFIISALSLFACDDCTLTSKNTTDMRIGFYKRQLTDAGFSFKDSVMVFDSISFAAPKKNILYRDAKGFLINKGANFTLMVQPGGKLDTASYYFIKSLGNRQFKRDTLSVTYNRILSVVTPDCGIDEQIYNLNVLKSTFKTDSLRVDIPELKIGKDMNIKFYFFK